ncbi:hypothetical protein PG990_013222 [Apiospora arundinis]|uniref:RRM Nup35-type domain-containing protein n=1 Tax=Apiospora arundinis TaxID=335852 RepID=A0ABR2HSX9_9PEZI
MADHTPMQDLLEGSVPASPPKVSGSELAPGSGRPMDGQPVTGAMRDLQALQDSVESDVGPLTRISSNKEENAPASTSLSEEEDLIQFDLSDNLNSAAQPHPQTNRPDLVQNEQSHPIQDAQLKFPPATPVNFRLESYNMVGLDSAYHPTTPSYHTHDRAYSPGVPEDTNTCVWLTGFPADVTVTRFIDEVQRLKLGRIAAIHINPPTDRIPTAGVKITMWDRASAERLFYAVGTHQFGGFPGHRIRPSWSRHKEGPRALESTSSRVLLIFGRTEIVNPRSMLP